MSAMHDTSKLDDLIVTTIDSIKGYEHSAEHARSAEYASFFRDMATDRRHVVAALQAESSRLGGTPADYGSAAATVHRRIEDIRRVLGGGDGAILGEIERGEDYLKEEFERVLADDRTSAETQRVVRDCFASVRRGHDAARELKHAFKSAA